MDLGAASAVAVSSSGGRRATGEIGQRQVESAGERLWIQREGEAHHEDALSLEVLKRTYTEDLYPNETIRAELSVKLGLTDKQLQMWFCHRRLKDRKPPPKRQQLEEEVHVPVMAPPPVLPPPLPHSELTMAPGGMYGEQLLPSSSRRGTGRPSAILDMSDLQCLPLLTSHG
uniref:Homeobox domain-containing protein n=1 Tax=Oryza barthii TaxID=65489 RepID=A0A0D3G618_9ORYZ